MEPMANAAMARNLDSRLLFNNRLIGSKNAGSAIRAIANNIRRFCSEGPWNSHRSRRPLESLECSIATIRYGSTVQLDSLLILRVTAEEGLRGLSLRTDGRASEKTAANKQMRIDGNTVFNCLQCFLKKQNNN